MKFRFLLAWAGGATGRRDFKSEAAFVLFSEYAKRISKFVPCEVSGLSDKMPKKPGTRLWLCDTSKRAKALSSEALARELEKLLNGGIQELRVGIGGPDGWGPEGPDELAADLLWSLGPMTLPHELAAIVAAEQVYRAFTILKNLPYHSGH